MPPNKGKKLRQPKAKEEEKPREIEVKGARTVVIGDWAKVVYNFIRQVDDKLLKRLGVEQRIGFGLLALLILGGTIYLYISLRPNQKEFMTGEFRIAIAAFTEDGKALPNDIGYTIGDGINIRLVSDLEELSVGPKVEIWGPDRVGTIKGKTSEARAQNAEKLAKQIHAHMIIYGLVTETTTGMLVLPEFYLDTQGFHEGSEVIGQYELGSSFPLPGANNPAWQFDFDKQMRTRSDIISSLAVGLSYFAVHRYEDALQSLQSIEAIEGWNEDQGKEVLYALIGFAAGKAKQYDITEAALEKAITINPDYARPYIGMANLNYILSLKPFEESKNVGDVDQSLLDQCFTYLDLAVQAPEKPPLAEVDTKINFARGQCYWLKAYTGKLPDFSSAIAEFNTVIKAYNDGENPRIYEFAAESHARLGLIYQLNNRLSEAAREYQTAANLLSTIPERQGLYQKRAEEIKQSLASPTP
jgi:tetratricopeptide (TPR) repeat protein